MLSTGNGTRKKQPHFTAEELEMLTSRSHIHSFISGMHHCKCVTPDVDISLQSRQF